MTLFLQKPSRRKTLFLIGRLLVSLVGAIGAVSATLLGMPNSTALAKVVPSNTGSAERPGKVCVFFAPSGAPILSSGITFGHVGWGFRVDQQDHWVYGATDGPQKDGSNGAWVARGTLKVMLSNFAKYRTSDGKGQYYTSYRCKDTTTSAVDSATQVAQGVKNQGYSIPNNDCLTHTIEVLKAYANHIFDGHGYIITPMKGDPYHKVSVLNDSPIPLDWFDALNINGFSPISPVSL